MRKGPWIERVIKQRKKQIRFCVMMKTWRSLCYLLNDIIQSRLFAFCLSSSSIRFILVKKKESHIPTRAHSRRETTRRYRCSSLMFLLFKRKTTLEITKTISVCFSSQVVPISIWKIRRWETIEHVMFLFTWSYHLANVYVFEIVLLFAFRISLDHRPENRNEEHRWWEEFPTKYRFCFLKLFTFFGRYFLLSTVRI